MLVTFQLVNNGSALSPALVTTREYGVWFEQEFDAYTAQSELYMKSRKKGGGSALEWHPGTKIGKWFDTNSVQSERLKCWYILQDSPMMNRLVKLNLAEQKDAIPIAVNDELGRRMLRVYTLEQIQLYIKSELFKGFNIAAHVGTPKRVVVRNSDFGKVVMPKPSIQKKKRLF